MTGAAFNGPAWLTRRDAAVTRLLSALIGGWPVITGQVQRICGPGKWRVWRDDAGLHVEVMG